MQLSLKDFASLVRLQAGAVSASCQQLVDVSVGSVLRAILEANASVGLWVQWLIVEVLATTRAATSQGSDLDTWVADFGMNRLPATPSKGTLSFSRSTAGLATTIPVGALARTGTDANAQIFAVAGDPTNTAWNGQGYAVASTDISVNVPVVAQTPGQAGNVQPGSVTMLATAIPGIDAVTNPAPMTGGLDAEADSALRSRFSGFLDSRNRATEQAVGYAILSIQQGLSYTIAEQVDTAGALRPGHFTVTVDDGTGAPSAALLAEVASAIEPVRPIGATFSVRGPLLYAVDVEMHVVAAPTAYAAIQAAVLGYVDTLPLGALLAISKLYQIAYNADPSVANVVGLTLNGSSADIVVPGSGLIRASNCSVSA